jgi:hypothetical protein
MGRSRARETDLLATRVRAKLRKIFTHLFGECRWVIHIVRLLVHPAAWQYPWHLPPLAGSHRPIGLPIPLLRVRALVRKVTHVHRPCFRTGKTGLHGGFL